MNDAFESAKRPTCENAARRAARMAYRAKIESLLNESCDAQLVDVWQRVSLFRDDRSFGLPDRSGIIADLADFAVVLRPNLSGMKGSKLCRLIERYAADDSQQFEQSPAVLA